MHIPHRLSRAIAVAMSSGIFLLPVVAHATSETTVTLFPSADASLANNQADTALGGSQTLALFADYGNNGRAALTFDLRTIPTSATITQATLGLTLTTTTGATVVSPNAFRITSAWNENSATWNNQPTYGEQLATSVVDSIPEKKTWDLTDAVKNWVAGTWQNYGIMIIGREGGPATSNYRREFWSREAGVSPTLAIRYTTPADVTPPAISNIQTAAPSSRSVRITWQTNEPSTASVEYGPTASYGTRVDDVGYALEQGVTLTGLTAGATYHYRVRSSDTTGNEAASADGTFTVANGTAVPGGENKPAAPASQTPGRLVKLACAVGADANHPCKAVYYVSSADNKRHAFPNAKIFNTWFADFSAVQTVPATELASYPLGRSVQYKPGVRMVKFSTLPKVYAVARGQGLLMGLASESAAAAIYGPNWNTKIDDLSDAFATDYRISPLEITSANDFHPDDEKTYAALDTELTSQQQG